MRGKSLNKESRKPRKYADNVGRCLDLYGDITYDLVCNLDIKIKELNNVDGLVKSQKTPI